MGDLARRSFLAGAASVAIHGWAKRVGAEDVTVPVARQADLMVRIAAYDRNLPARANGKVKVLVLTNPNDGDSRSVGAQMEAALSKLETIAKLPREVSRIDFAGADQVAASCKTSRISIVYVTPGLEPQLAPLAKALAGVDVLSVGALGRHATQGTVLAFDLESSRPIILVNLGRAKQQNVDISAEALHLMKVVS